MKSEKNELEQIKEYIKKSNEIHLEETAYLVQELGGFGIGSGFELANIPFPKKAETEKEYKELALSDSICQFWRDAGVSFKNRRFRACTILLACLIEAVIYLELSRRKKSYPQNSTLGQLIAYCEKEKILLEILNEIKSVNKLRNIAIHLIYEKKTPEKLLQSEIFDEIVPLEKFKDPPAKVKMKPGYIEAVGDDVDLILFPNQAIRYRYKKLAKAMYNHVQSILKTLYGMKFNFGFNEDIKI